MIKSIQFHLEKYRCRRVVNRYLKNGGQRVYHYHIMKTGGTSINSAFFSLSEENSEVIDRHIIYHPEHYFRAPNQVFSRGNWLIESGLFTYGFSHIPKWNIEVPEDAFTFTCLRDPLKRLISRYHHLQSMYQSPYKQRFEQDQGALVNWLQADFATFVERVSEKEKHEMLYMFSQNLDPYEAFEQLKTLDYFFFLEEIGEGIKQLGTKLNLPLTLKWANKSGYREAISDEMKAEVKEKYLKDDYTFFQLARDYYKDK